MKKYNVALIGCGQMGVVHIEQIYFKENVNVKYVCDINIERANECKRKYGAEYAETDYNVCIASKNVDIVIIATYPSTHLELLKLCIEHGKHVICEKPIAANYSDGEKFIKLVKANPQCKVLIGHILRHNATYKAVADMIHNGAVGKPMVLRMSQNHHTMNLDRYRTLIEETSPIIDCGVHYIDIMRWFTNEEIVDISGIGARTDTELSESKYNYGLATFRLSGGSVGFYEAGWSKTMSSDNSKEFFGPKGSIKIILGKDRVCHKEEGDLVEYYNYETKEYRQINIQAERKPTGIQFDYLIKMIEENIEASPSIDEVFESFKIAIKADEIINNSKNKTEG